MEEFLLVLHYRLRVGEFDFDVAHKEKTTVEFDWDVIVNPLQVG